MLFSIIIPVFNCENYIKSCVESVVNQSFSEFEIIFVDNNSSDKSIYIIEQLMKTDNRLKLIKCSEQSAGMARNAGIKSALGKYIITVDADDKIDLHLLENLKNIIDNNDIDLIKFNAYQIDNANRILNNKMFCTKQTGVLGGSEAFNYCCQEFCVKGIISGPSWLYAIKKEYFTNKQLFFSNLLQEDFGLFLYLLLYARKVYFLDYVGYYYVFRENSITNNYFNQMQKAKDLVKHCAEYKRHIILSKNICEEIKYNLSKFLKKTLNDKYNKLADEYKKEFLKLVNEESLDDIYYNTRL